MDDLINLEKLEELRKSGRISDAEFAEQKRNLFNKSLRAGGMRDNPKSGIIYILLAWFVGTLGIHNFYAGFIGRGVIQLLLTLTAPFFLFLPLIITAVWAYIELMLQNKSRNGMRLRGRKAIIRGLKFAATAWLAFAMYSASYIKIDVPIISIDENDIPQELLNY